MLAVLDPLQHAGVHEGGEPAAQDVPRDAQVVGEGVERTETSLVMGEVIGYRVGPLMDLARDEI